MVNTKKILKPRREVNNALRPKVSCPNMQIPTIADISSSLTDQLMNQNKVWCKKKQVVCPIDIILHKLDLENK